MAEDTVEMDGGYFKHIDYTSESRRGGVRYSIAAKCLKSLLGTVIISLTFGVLLYWALQEEDLETIEVRDLEPLTNLGGLEEIVGKHRDPFNGPKVGRVFQPPIHGPILYMERMIDPSIVPPSNYKTSILGVTFLPPLMTPTPRYRSQRELVPFT